MSFSPQRLSDDLGQSLRDAGAARGPCCIALSGGLDSTVLLCALAAVPALAPRPLRAIHVDHALHPDSARWSGHSRALAARCGVPCEVVRVDARPARGESPEAAARAARYAALAEQLGKGEVLLTAHHGDDQLESVLLQWLRGGGLRAVAGMRAVTPFAAGWLARPLLGYTRDELRDWAVARGLDWLEDPSNSDPRYDRNYLRMAVLPALRARWPAAARTVGRVAARAGEALEFEAERVGADLAAVAVGETLALDRLVPLPPARQRLVLRAWLRSQGVDPPSLATLDSLRHDVLVAGAERIPETRWPGAAVRRYRGRLYASAVATGTPWQAAVWTPGTTFELGALGRLELHAGIGEGLSRDRLTDPLDVVPRPAGARFLPAGAAHRRELRKWLQEHGVLPWQRDTLPCIRVAGEIVAIGDLACGGGLAAVAGEPSWRVVWHGRPTLTEGEAIAHRPAR